MKGEKFETTWKELARVRFNRSGSNGRIDLLLVARRNLVTGEIRFQILIPNAERIAFADDLPVLLQCFGWGIAALGMDARLMKGDWIDCCTVLGKVDSCLRDE